MSDFKWISYRFRERLIRWFMGEGRRSYAQCGEDIIARFVFDTLRIVTPSFLDIGAHHPRHLNNTFIFYAQGARGVNIEPDPALFRAFQQQRPGDCNLNIGIGEREASLPFYVMSEPTLNTFSEAEARAVECAGKIRITNILDLPVRPVGTVMMEYFNDAPDFLSLDVEGLDLSILQGIDFQSHRPKLICVETITYSEDRCGKKITAIGELLGDHGYQAYADTHVNTLFIDRRVW